MYKSIRAILGGFILVVILSVATDLLLVSAGAMKMPFDTNASWFIWLVIGYRTIYGMAGSYITAALAPGRPMRHVMIGGGIGFLLTIVGAVVMREEGPSWYPMTLIVLALPTAWAGGKLRASKLNAS